MSQDSSTALRLLYVEDNEDDQIILKRLFEKAGIPVHMAFCIRGETALEQLEKSAVEYDVVVVDYELPGITGIELCKQLLARNIPVPIVFMTGHGSEQLAVEALKMGVDDYVIKTQMRGSGELVTRNILNVVKKYRNNAERMLLRQKLDMLIEQAPDGIIIVNKQGLIEQANQTIHNIFGYNQGELLNQHVNILIPEGMHAAHGKYLDQFFAKPKTRMMGKRPFSGVKKDGAEIFVDIKLCPQSTGDDLTVAAFITDMKLRLHARKLEAVSSLVSGIAHNFNNMLTGMIGQAYLAKKSTHDPLTLKHLDKIENIGHESAKMISQLLTFARRDRVNKEDVAFTSFIRQTLHTAILDIPKDIKITTQFCDEELYIHADMPQLQQVFMHLLDNACDALEYSEKREISISVNKYVQDDSGSDDWIEVYGADMACLEVKDSGMGIPAKHLGHLYEPFFTTKGPDKGTGLGLSMSYGAVEEHGGEITVDSSPGCGSTFRVYFPLLDTQIEEVQEQQDKLESHGVEVQNNDLTVLVVDDNSNVRLLVTEVLQSEGLNVLTAEDGVDAIHLLESGENEIHLVISDVVMPNMGGAELYRHVHARRTDLPFIFITGYDAGALNNIGKDIADLLIVHKPIDIESLIRQVNECLCSPVQRD